MSHTDHHSPRPKPLSAEDVVTVLKPVLGDKMVEHLRTNGALKNDIVDLLRGDLNLTEFQSALTESVRTASRDMASEHPPAVDNPDKTYSNLSEPELRGLINKAIESVTQRKDQARSL